MTLTNRPPVNDKPACGSAVSGKRDPWAKADEAARDLAERDTPARRHRWAVAVKRALGVADKETPR